MERQDLVSDIRADEIIIGKLDNENYAKQMYGAITNMKWCKIDGKEQLFNIMRDDLWTASFRTAAGIIADLRDHDETYVDFYCSSSEGVVPDEIRDDLYRIGWKPVPWPDDY